MEGGLKLLVILSRAAAQVFHCASIKHGRLSISTARRKAGCSHLPSHSCAGALLIIAALLLAIPAAHAGRYELIKGKGVEVCEVYGRNLNASGEIWPMNCERKVLPQFAKEGLTKPEWRSLDPVKHFDLVIDVDRLLNPTVYVSGKAPKGDLDILRRRAEKGTISLNIANIDFNHDGNREPVLKFSYGCSPPGSGGWWATPLLVADPSLSRVDLPKSRPLLQNEMSDAKKYPAGGWTYAMYDVFLFKNKSYFDRWSDFKAETGTLRVFQTERNITTEICTYEYRYDH